MCKQKTAKRLICTLFMMSVPYIAGCFNGYVRDYSKDYVKEKAGQPLVIPEHLNPMPFAKNAPIPEVASQQTQPLHPNEIPAPVYTITGADGFDYQTVNTSHGIVIESNADRNKLWHNLINFLQEKKIDVIRKNEDDGIIESAWVTVSTKNSKKSRFIPSLFRSKKENQQSVKFLFSLEQAAKNTHYWQIRISLQSVPDNYSMKENVHIDSAITNDITQEIFVFLIKQSETSDAVKVQEKPEVLDAKTMTLLTVDGQGQPILEINSPFDTAWNAIKKALKKEGVTIQYANYNAGIYYIHLQNADSINLEKHDAAAVSKQLFGVPGSNNIKKAPVYRLVLSPADKEIYVYLEKDAHTRASFKLNEIILDRLWKKL